MTIIKNCNINNEVKDILIINNKVVKIGKIKLDDVKNIFEDIYVVDGKGKFAISSYIDNHVHIIGGGGEMGYSSRIPEIKLQNIVLNGVTTLVGVLGTDSISKKMSNLVAKTKALNNDGLSCYCLTGAYEFPSPTLTGRIQDDIYFINEIIGLKCAISDNRCYNPSKEDLIKAISELRVAMLASGKGGGCNIHCGWGKGNLNVILEILNETNIPASIIRPTHITNNENVFIQAFSLAKKNAYVDITASEDYEKVSYYINKIKDAGLYNQVTLSSDANGSCPVWKDNKCVDIKASSISVLHETVLYLVKKCNYSLNDAIKILTINPANALNLHNKGYLSEGNDADLILLDSEYNINDVISNGQLMVSDKKVLKKGYYSI